jgi:hypothetical protein
MAKLPQLTKGKHWTLKVVPRIRHGGGECWCLCVPIGREILITKSTERSGISRVTFLHEMIHKICWWMDESAVEQMAQELDESLDVMESILL